MNRADKALIGITIVASLMVLVPLTVSFSNSQDFNITESVLQAAYGQTDADFGATTATTNDNSELVPEFETTSAEVDSFQPWIIDTTSDSVVSSMTFEQIAEDMPLPVSIEVIEDSEMIQVTTTLGKVVYQKDSGAGTFFDESGVIIKSDSYVVRGAEINTDVWFNLDVNSLTPDVSVEFDEYVAVVKVVRENDEGKFIVENIVDDNVIKTTAYFTNGSYIDHKFAFTETLELPDNLVKLNDQDIDLSIYSGQSFSREVLEQNEDLFIQAKEVYFSAGLGFQYLWQVNVHEVTSEGYYPVSLDWANVEEVALPIGSTIDLDPTTAWTYGSWLGNTTNSQPWASVAIDANGNLVVQGDKNDKFWVFDKSNGTLLQTISWAAYPYGQGHGFEVHPVTGNWWIWSINTLEEIEVSGSSGNYSLNQINTYDWNTTNGPFAGQCSYVKDLAFSPVDGNGWLACNARGNGGAVEFNETNGQYIGKVLPNYWENYTGITVDGNNGVYLSNSSGGSYFIDQSNSTFTFFSGAGGNGQDNDWDYDTAKDVVIMISQFAGSSGEIKIYPVMSNSNGSLNSIQTQLYSETGWTYYKRGVTMHDGTSYHSGGWNSPTPIVALTWAFPPATPSAPTASTSGGINTVTWTADPAVTQYKVFRNGANLVATLGAVGTYTDSSVTGGTAYTYQLEATNSAGTSAFSPASNSVTPITSPSTPSAPTATTSGGINTVTWTAPANGGSAITDYKIYVSGTGISNYDFNTGNSATSWTHTNPVLGIPYQYQIVAYNSIGSTNPSSGSNFVTPSTAPATPSAPSVTTSGGNNYLTWTAPSSNGSAITGYEIWRNGGVYWTVGNVLSFDNTTQITLGSSYYYQIQAINANGYSSVSGNSNTVIPALVPTAPSAPVATFVSNTSNTVTWSVPASNGSAITNYELFRNGSTLGNVGNVLTYTDTGLTIGSSNIYSLKAINGIGSSLVSSNSNTIINANPPDAPTGLTAVTGSPITMTWTTPSSDMTITNYKIYRDGSLIDTLGVTTSYTDNTTSAGNSYIFEISAVSAAGEGNKSNSSTATHGTAPDAPTNLTVIYNEPNADLTWVAPTVTNGAPVIGYKIETSLDGANWSPLTVTTNTNLTYSHTNPTVGSDNYYRVSAINSIGTGVPGNVASVLAAIIPTAPLSLTTTQTVPFFLDLSWSVPSDDGDTPITNYKVYRDGSLVTTLGVVTTYQDNTMQHIGHTHSYEVSAVNLIGESPKSNASSVTGWDVPSATTSVTATPRAGLQNEIDWTAPTSDGGTSITGYRIQSSTDNVTFTDVVASTTTQPYTHTGLTQGTTYYYKVSAINGIGEGTFGAASATVGDVPDAPASLTVVPQAGMQMTITVTIPNDNGYTISSYSLQRSTDNFTTFTVVGPQTSNVFVDYPLNIGTSYQYKALATNSLGDSALSSASATTVAGDVPSTPVAPGTVVGLS